MENPTNMPTFAAPMEKLFEKAYSLNVARLAVGHHTDTFQVEDDFFTHFPHSIIEGAKVTVTLDMEKTGTHLDITMHFAGDIFLPCDRCMELYPFAVSFSRRVIYSFSPSLKMSDDIDIVFVEKSEDKLVLAQDFYDFLTIEVPLRRVPAKEIHLCAPAVLQMLNLDEHGNPLHPEEENLDEDITDPSELLDDEDA